MQIEMTTSHYADAAGFKLTGAGMYEVPDERGRYLLATFPDWFQAVAAQDSTGDAPDQSAGGQEQPEPDVPVKPLSKMNKDELQSLAMESGLGISSEMTNDELREAIKSHQEGLTESSEDEAGGDAV